MGLSSRKEQKDRIGT